MRTLRIITVMLWAFLGVSRALAAPGDPPPPVEEGLLDCSLYRYGERFDEALAGTMKRIAHATDTDATLRDAFSGNMRQEVTQRLYQLTMLQGVPGCSQPVIRGYAGKGQVELEVQAVQKPVCDQLTGSDVLRLAGMRVEPLHVPSGELRCGFGRNPVPGFLTLGGLTQAGRSLPGENTITVIAQGPFAAPPPVVTRPSQPPACPEFSGRPDPVVEKMLSSRQKVEYDFPQQWEGEACFDFLGGPSSTGMTCNVANWNNHQERLYEQFEAIMTRAEASGDTERIFSAAHWLIERNDPMQLTILSFDYDGQDCDAIRNRIVVVWGTCLWDEVESFLELPEALGSGAPAVLKNKVLTAVLPCFVDDDLSEFTDRYQKADAWINEKFRPMPAPEKRRQILARVQQRVRSAMAKSGYGDCSYYSDAVIRMDKTIWRDQYDNTVESLPIDWEHSFWKSARRCAALAW